MYTSTKNKYSSKGRKYSFTFLKKVRSGSKDVVKRKMPNCDCDCDYGTPNCPHLWEKVK